MDSRIKKDLSGYFDKNQAALQFISLIGFGEKVEFDINNDMRVTITRFQKKSVHMLGKLEIKNPEGDAVAEFFIKIHNGPQVGEKKQKLSQADKQLSKPVKKKYMTEIYYTKGLVSIAPNMKKKRVDEVVEISEYCAGGSLEGKAKELKLKEKELKLKDDSVKERQSVARKYLGEIAEMLQAFNKEGVYFPDIKPSNFLIRPNGTLVISDRKSLYKVKSEKEKIPYKAIENQTTAHYLPPDLFGKQDTIEKIDVKTLRSLQTYLMGVTLYELMTGVDVSALLRDPVTGVHQFNFEDAVFAGDEGERLKNMIKSLIQTDPEKRPSMEAVGELLGSSGLDQPIAQPLAQSVAAVAGTAQTLSLSDKMPTNYHHQVLYQVFLAVNIVVANSDEEKQKWQKLYNEHFFTAKMEGDDFIMPCVESIANADANGLMDLYAIQRLPGEDREDEVYKHYFETIQGLNLPSLVAAMDNQAIVYASSSGEESKKLDVADEEALAELESRPKGQVKRPYAYAPSHELVKLLKNPMSDVAANAKLQGEFARHFVAALFIRDDKDNKWKVKDGIVASLIAENINAVVFNKLITLSQESAIQTLLLEGYDINLTKPPTWASWDQFIHDELWEAMQEARQPVKREIPPVFIHPDDVPGYRTRIVRDVDPVAQLPDDEIKALMGYLDILSDTQQDEATLQAKAEAQKEIDQILGPDVDDVDVLDADIAAMGKNLGMMNADPAFNMDEFDEQSVPDLQALDSGLEKLKLAGESIHSEEDAGELDRELDKAVQLINDLKIEGDSEIEQENTKMSQSITPSESHADARMDVLYRATQALKDAVVNLRQLRDQCEQRYQLEKLIAFFSRDHMVAIKAMSKGDVGVERMNIDVIKNLLKIARIFNREEVLDLLGYYEQYKKDAQVMDTFFKQNPSSALDEARNPWFEFKEDDELKYFLTSLSKMDELRKNLNKIDFDSIDFERRAKFVPPTEAPPLPPVSRDVSGGVKATATSLSDVPPPTSPPPPPPSLPPTSAPPSPPIGLFPGTRWRSESKKIGGANVGEDAHTGVYVTHDEHGQTRRALIKQDWHQGKLRVAKVISEGVAGQVLKDIFKNQLIEQRRLAQVSFIRADVASCAKLDESGHGVYVQSDYIDGYQDDFWKFAYKQHYLKKIQERWQSAASAENKAKLIEKWKISMIDYCMKQQKVIAKTKDEKVRDKLEKMNGQRLQFVNDTDFKRNDKDAEGKENLSTLQDMLADMLLEKERPNRPSSVFRSEPRKVTSEAMKTNQEFMQQFAELTAPRLLLGDFGVHNGNLGIRKNPDGTLELAALDFGAAFNKPPIHVNPYTKIKYTKDKSVHVIYKNHFLEYGPEIFASQAMAVAFIKMGMMPRKDLSGFVDTAIGQLDPLYGIKPLQQFCRRLGMKVHSYKDLDKQDLLAAIKVFMIDRLESRKASLLHQGYMLMLEYSLGKNGFDEQALHDQINRVSRDATIRQHLRDDLAQFVLNKKEYGKDGVTRAIAFDKMEFVLPANRSVTREATLRKQIQAYFKANAPTVEISLDTKPADAKPKDKEAPMIIEREGKLRNGIYKYLHRKSAGGHQTRRERLSQEVVESDGFLKDLKYDLTASEEAKHSIAGQSAFVSVKSNHDDIHRVLTTLKDDLTRKLAENPKEAKQLQARMDRIDTLLEINSEILTNIHKLEKLDKFSEFRLYQGGSTVVRRRVPVNDADKVVASLHSSASSTDKKSEFTLSNAVAKKVPILLDEMHKDTVTILTDNISEHTVMSRVIEPNRTRIILDQTSTEIGVATFFKAKSSEDLSRDDTFRAAVIMIDDARRLYGDNIKIRNANPAQLEAAVLYCAFLNAEEKPASPIQLKISDFGKDLVAEKNRSDKFDRVRKALIKMGFGDRFATKSEAKEAEKAKARIRKSSDAIDVVLKKAESPDQPTPPRRLGPSRKRGDTEL